MGSDLVKASRVLVIGASGMVGSRFVEKFGGSNFLTPDFEELDITKKELVKKYIEENRPDVIINFAAYTNVNDAELQKGNKDGDCWKLNVEGVRNILDAIDPGKMHFIQISTDMVKSGSKEDPGPYDESQLAETDPDKLTWYGYTKAEAERIIIERLGDKATIVRIIYPVTDHFEGKLDYLRDPLTKYKKKGKLPYPLFNDQQVNITDVDDVANALRVIVEGDHHGVFHVASSDFSYPYKIISKFLTLIEGKEIQLEQKPMGEMEKRYSRYGGLKTEETQKILGLKFNTIEEILSKLVGLGVGKKLIF